MEQAQASKTRRRQEELAADQRMLEAMQRSPQRTVQQQAAPSQTVQFSQSGPHQLGGYDDTGHPIYDSQGHTAMRTAPGNGTQAVPMQTRSAIEAASGAPENSSAHFNARYYELPKTPQLYNSAVKGRANLESTLSEAPVLRFKSDNTFLTPGELEQRAAAASELKDALSAQIEEKKQRKAAEKALERAREAEELVCTSADMFCVTLTVNPYP
jgi:hypothetical protein